METSLPSQLPEQEKIHTLTGNDGIIPPEQRNSSTLPARSNLESPSQTVTIHSQNAIWILAFLTSLQCYCLLEIGSNVSLAQKESPGVVGVPPIVLFAPTMMTLISIIRFSEALETVEFLQ